MHRLGTLCCLLVFLLLVSSGSAPGGVPDAINYQGRLLSGTNLVNGDVSVSLRLYTTASGGTRIYEDSNVVTVVDGLYSTQIGDNTTYGSLEQALDHTNLYIEVWVNGVALSPREPLCAVAFARQSGPRGVGNQETGLHSFVGGGETNIASDYTATVGGGRLNQANGDYSTVGGGRNNEAVNFYDTVAGGYGNTATGQRSTVGGGQGNTAGGSYSTIPGGMNNIARGDYSLAAGRRAQASNDGCFVWSDSEDADFTSTDTNQFIIRAEGGVGVGTASPRQQLSVGSYLDLYSGSANSPAQPSIRGSILGHLFLNGRGNGDVYINSDSGSNLIVNLNGGRVGIGTNNPPAKLSVAGNAYITEVVYAESFVGNGSGLTSLDGANIAAGTVDNAQLTDGAVTSNKLAINSVTRIKIAANAVDTSEIADFAVTSNKIAANAVGGDQIAAGAVGSVEIATGAVGSSELATGAVDTDEIVDGAVTWWKLQDKYWKLNGNADTTNAVHFLGTTDDEPLDLKVSGRRVLRLQPSTTYTPNLIGGDSANAVSNDAMGCAIAGGGSASVPNRISDEYGFVGAGFGNVAGDSDANVADAQCAAVVGGRRNTAAGYSSAVGGGDDNEASGRAAFVGGGRTNLASGNMSFVGGGEVNAATGELATVAGGYRNEARGENATVGGGAWNVASGLGATVAGGGGDSPFLFGQTSNRASGIFGTVCGGANNINAGTATTIAGGHRNKAESSADCSLIGSGESNIIDGAHNVLCGGRENNAGGKFVFLGGGENNQVSGMYGAVGGGVTNRAAGKSAVIGGGATNVAGGDFATVGGGAGNRATQDYATVSGGWNNKAGATAAFIGGGYGNAVSSEYAVVGGGQSNVVMDTFSKFAVIAGGFNNRVQDGTWCFVGGGCHNYIGGQANTVAGGYDNRAEGKASTVGGGSNNTAGAYGYNYAFVGGGAENDAAGNFSAVGGGHDNDALGDYSVVGGGYDNTATGTYAFIGGGQRHRAPGTYAFIGGGQANYAHNYSVVGGGVSNTAYYYGAILGGIANVATGRFSAIPGGVDNDAGGDYSFAAGRRARAVHDGSFVWGDSQDADVSSTANNQVTFRCLGGVRFQDGAGNQARWEPGDASWTITSDRNQKENFAPVNSRDVLERVCSIPLTEWNYRGYDVRHIGPMAQDFKARFADLGRDDKGIDGGDLHGVSLAAIQGLYKMVKDLQTENAELRREIEALKAQ